MTRTAWIIIIGFVMAGAATWFMLSPDYSQFGEDIPPGPERIVVSPGGEIKISLAAPKNQKMILQFQVLTDKANYIEKDWPLLPTILEVLASNSIKNGYLLEQIVPRGGILSKKFSVPVLRKLPIGTKIRIDTKRDPIIDIEGEPGTLYSPLWPEITGVLQSPNSHFELDFYRPIQEPRVSCMYDDTVALVAQGVSGSVSFNNGRVSTDLREGISLSYSPPQGRELFYPGSSITFKEREGGYFTINGLYGEFIEQRHQLYKKLSDDFLQTKEAQLDKSGNLSLTLANGVHVRFLNVSHFEVDGTAEVFVSPQIAIKDSSKIVMDIPAISDKAKFLRCQFFGQDDIQSFSFSRDLYRE